MGQKRKDKVRRRAARKKRATQKRIAREGKPPVRPLVAVPNPLASLTKEQAEEIANAHHQAARDARPRLVELLQHGDWRVMLAQLSAYRLTLAVKEGQAVELDDTPVQPAVEYLQAVALSLQANG